MKIKSWFNFFTVIALLSLLGGFFAPLRAQTSDQNFPQVSDYASLQAKILQGWNTWDNRSIMTHVLLPEALAIHLQILDTLRGDSLTLAFTGNQVAGSEKVRTLAHTPNGSYTDFVMTWRNFGLRIQSAANGENIYLLVTPTDSLPNPGYLMVKSTFMYSKPGEVHLESGKWVARAPSKTYTIRSLGREGRTTGHTLLEPFTGLIGLSNDPEASLRSVQAIIQAREVAYQQRKTSFGDLAEVYNALQNVLNWHVVYDPAQHRAVTPVARPWSYGWGNRQPGGYILFAGTTSLLPTCTAWKARNWPSTKPFRCAGKLMN
ncbi:MAG: hypothetical protein HC880_09845 [Bacteroidia bacterium]|nr:hypothetical protein [Bacteroidia bacterium]